MKTRAQQAQWEQRKFIGTCLRNAALVRSLLGGIVATARLKDIGSDAIRSEADSAIRKLEHALQSLAVAAGWKPAKDYPLVLTAQRVEDIQEFEALMRALNRRGGRNDQTF